jgi:hypothetical protein
MENEMRTLVLRLGHAWVNERQPAIRASQSENEKTPTEAAQRFDGFLPERGRSPRNSSSRSASCLYVAATSLNTALSFLTVRAWRRALAALSRRTFASLDMAGIAQSERPLISSPNASFCGPADDL